MNSTHEVRFEYDAEGDVLDIYFSENRRAWTIELTANINLSIDRQSKTVVGLTFLDYTELARPTELGPRSFPLTGLAEMPHAERELVMRVLTQAPLNDWLDVSVVQDLPDSPFVVMHLQPSASELLAHA